MDNSLSFSPLVLPLSSMNVHHIYFFRFNRYYFFSCVFTSELPLRSSSSSSIFLIMASKGYLNMDRAVNHRHPLGIELYLMKNPLNRNMNASRAVPAPLPYIARAVAISVVVSSVVGILVVTISSCLLYTSPSPRDGLLSRMPSSA